LFLLLDVLRQAQNALISFNEIAQISNGFASSFAADVLAMLHHNLVYHKHMPGGHTPQRDEQRQRLCYQHNG
jgi:hypothetical protein